MVLAKSKTAVGLGNSLMNDRFGKGKGGDMRRANFNQSIKRTDAQGETVSARRWMPVCQTDSRSTSPTSSPIQHG